MKDDANKEDQDTNNIQALDDSELDSVLGGFENVTLEQQQKKGLYPRLNEEKQKKANFEESFINKKIERNDNKQ
ncbi:MAG: hypothetical protein LBT82_03680 [Oscillospiraceae bacterium]|jgi:hypothetical protein|nr:hypothetical protein [Oscillospiraceae bacterium]